MHRPRLYGDNTFWVTNNSDNINIVGSFRWAVARANVVGGDVRFVDVIEDLVGIGDQIWLTKSIPTATTNVYETQLVITNPNVAVYGNGHTVIKNKEPYSCLIEGYAGVVLTSINDCLFKDFTISRANTEQYVGWAVAKECHFENCHFDNIKGTGYTSFRYCSFSNCDLKDLTCNYVMIQGCTTTLCRLIRCSSTQTLRNGGEYSRNYTEDCGVGATGSYCTSVRCPIQGTTLTYINSTLIDCPIQNMGSYTITLNACTIKNSITRTDTLSTACTIIFNRCLLLLESADLSVRPNQTISGSENLFVANDSWAGKYSAIGVRHVGSDSDLADSLTMINPYTGILPPKGDAIGFVPNATPTGEYHIYDIRGYVRGNPTCAGSYAAEVAI